MYPGHKTLSARSILLCHIQLSPHLSGQRQSTCHVLKQRKQKRWVFDLELDNYFQIFGLLGLNMMFCNLNLEIET